MNVEIGAEAAQFPQKEYINGIAVAVHTTLSPAAAAIRQRPQLWRTAVLLRPRVYGPIQRPIPASLVDAKVCTPHAWTPEPEPVDQ